MKKKLIRITTVPGSLRGLLQGQMKFMSNHYEVIGISSNMDGYLEDISLLEGVKTIPVNMTRNITPIQDLIGVYKLYKIFKKEQPYIVHTHTPKAGTLGMMAAKLAGVPHRLHTIAGLPLIEETGLKRQILNAVEKITYACATTIYPNSFGLKDIILENKFTIEDKLKIIGNGSSNGINTAYFNPDLFNESDKSKLREENHINEDDIVFVFLGRLVTDKGINELIESFVKINEKHSNTKLLVVGIYEAGNDALKKHTVELIKTHKNIIQVGWQKDVRPYLAIATALAFPSYREGFPNVVLQASAMKLPCIVTNINGCNEIIAHGETGIIIPVKNSEKLYDAMEQLIAMPDNELKTMGEISRALIVSKYDQQFVWNAILMEYNNLN